MLSFSKNKLNTTGVLWIIAFVIFCHGNALDAQGTDMLKRNHPGFFISVGFGPAKSTVGLTKSESLPQLVLSKANASSGSIKAGYMLSRNIGISGGLEYSSYGSKIFMNSYFGTFDAVDDESEHFSLSIAVLNLEEIQKISSLNIPFSLIFRLPLSKKLGIYFEPGLNLSIPLSPVFSSNGIFTFTGYYPAYNITLGNLPSHNFPSGVDLSDDGELILKSFWLNSSASAGFDFYIQRKIQITAGISYFSSVSDIGGYKSPEKFQISSGYPEINSIMGSSKKTILNSTGVNICFRYFLK